MKSKKICTWISILLLSLLSIGVSAQDNVWQVMFDDGQVAEEKGNYAEAYRKFDSALREAGFPIYSNRHSMQSLAALARVCAKDGRLEHAKEFYNRLFSLEGENPQRSADDLAKEREQLADGYLSNGQSFLAERYYEGAIQSWKKEPGDHRANVAKVYQHWAERLLTDDSPLNAKRRYQQSLDICEGKAGEIPYLAASALRGIGTCLKDCSQYAQAQDNMRRALEIDISQSDEDGTAVAKDLTALAMLYYSQGQYEQAEVNAEKALHLVIGKSGTADENADAAMAKAKNTATAKSTLALMYTDEHRFPAAQDLLENVIALREKIFGPVDHRVARSHCNLAAMFNDWQRYDRAEGEYRKALDIDRQVFAKDEDNPDLEQTTLMLANFLMKEKKAKEAEDLYRWLLKRDQRKNEMSGAVASDLEDLAIILRMQGRTEDAAGYERQASEIISRYPSAVHRSEPSVIARKTKGAPELDAPVQDKWALVVGISSFKDPSINLKYAAKDAADFRNFLVKEEHFEENHVRLLIDSQATREEIVACLGDKWLGMNAKKDDLIVIYISTHGSAAVNVKGDPNFIVSYETNLSNLVLTGIPMQWLTYGLKHSTCCQRAIVIMDVCHSAATGEGSSSSAEGSSGGSGSSEGSGGSVESASAAAFGTAEAGGRSVDSGSSDNSGGSAGAAASIRSSSSANSGGSGSMNASEGRDKASKGIFRQERLQLRDAKIGEGQVVLASSEAEQVSWESKRYPNSVFTRRLMEGLRQNHENTTISEAFKYIEQEVEGEVLRDRNQDQRPILVKQWLGKEAALGVHPSNPRRPAGVESAQTSAVP